jgi:hypothetical protein
MHNKKHRGEDIWSREKKFKILKFMRPYDYKRQCKIVIVCCILHNFIRKHTEVSNVMLVMDTSEDERVAMDPIIAASIGAYATEIGANIRQEIRN